MIIWLCFAAFLSTCFLTYLIRRYALAKSLIDIPNARSSHSVPTPRGGGLSVVIVSLSCLLFLSVAFFPLTGFNLALLGIIVASFCVAGIGFWDDHRHIPARWRLLVHFAASVLALLSLSLVKLPMLAFFGFQIDNDWLLGILYLFGLVWLLNLYNFMDGIDGIASVEAITVALSAATLLFMRSEGEGLSVLLLLFSSAIAGFLVWNFPHAKIFMGDACSGFLGFSLGLFALVTSIDLINLWSWLILLAAFITDATFTLIKRVLNGAVWYEAHSSHAYQHYARRLTHAFQQQGYEHREARTKSHRRVNLILSLINLFWLLPLAAAATLNPFWAPLIVITAFMPLLFIAHTLKAGISE